MAAGGASSAWWVTSERLSGTVTFLFSDIEGSTTLLKQVGRERYGELLARHQGLVREAFAAHHGREVDTQGDSFFAAFHSAADAVAAAVAIQRALAAEGWPDGARVRVRIGIHSGEASAAGERYVGFSVHRAARVGAVGHGGQILISDSTRSLVEDDLPDGVTLHNLGAHRLKDVARPERISQVVTDDLQEKFPPLRGVQPSRSRRFVSRRSLVVAALAGVLAVVAVMVLVLGRGSSGKAASKSIAANAVGLVDRTGAVTSSITLGTAPTAIATGAGAIWTANFNADSVDRIDPRSKAVVQTINVGNGPAAISVGGGYVWVANSLSGSVSKIDPRASGGSVVDTISVGNSPSGVAYGMRSLWVANSADRTVVPVDPDTDRLGRPISVERGADTVAIGFGALWVTSASTGSLARVDPHTSSVTLTINVGNGADALAVGPSAVWVANSLDGTVSHVDPATNVATTFDAGDSPSGIAVATGNRVWVSNDRAGTLSRIDPTRNSVVQTVTTGNRPEAIATNGAAVVAAVQGSGTAHRGGTLTVLEGQHVGGIDNSLDPAIGGYWDLLTITNDGLVTYNRSGGGAIRVVPDLATALPTPANGGKTYTFRLRPDIRYSSGAHVRPADIRRGLERLLMHPGFAAGFFDRIEGAKDCTKRRCDLSRGITSDPETNTVTIHLSEPDPDLLYKLALPNAVAVPSGTPAKAHLPLPATGPYMVKGYDLKHGRTVLSITLVRNPYFHEWSPLARPAGYPAKIVKRFGYADRAALHLVEQGKADLTQLAPSIAVTPLRRRYASQLHVNAVLQTLYLWFNTKKPPFDNLRARQAVNYALDRRRMLALAGGEGIGLTSCQTLPPNLPGYRRYCPYTVGASRDGIYKGPDRATARKLVASSGTSGQAVSVMVFKWYRDLGRYIATTLDQLGYRARLKVFMNADAFFKANDDPKKKFQAGIGGWNADFPAASDFFVPLLTCASAPIGGNVGLFCNKRIDADIARARALQTTDPYAAAKLWGQVDRETVDQAPWVAFGELPTTVLVSRRVGNYQFSPFWGPAYDQLWVR